MPELSDQELLATVQRGCAVVRMFECDRLQAAAAWSDRNPGIENTSLADLRRGKERGSRLGGAGTPIVAEFAPAELAAAIGTTTGAARYLMADALDLRHRLPRLWRRVVEAEVEAWQARRVAQATRPLTCEQARLVDAEVADLVGGMAWSRLERVLDGQIISVDPERAARLAEQAARARFVGVGGSDEHGTRSVVARIASADAAWLDAVVDRLADLLATRRGVVGVKDERRAFALGLLARPVEALQLLTEEPDDTAIPDGTAIPDDTEDPDPAGPDDPVEPADEPGVGVLRSALAAPGRLARDDILAAVQRIGTAACRPQVVLYAHVAAEVLAAGTGVVRVEQLGPQVLATVRDWLSHANVTVRPVIDLPNGTGPTDAYEVPTLMREHLILTRPVSVFPWATGTSRSAQMDHSQPFDHDRPAGKRQTRVGNLAPLAAFGHRLVTHGGWQRRQPEPGTMLFRAPRGRVLLVDHLGTRDLGTGRFATLTWQACDPRAQNWPPPPD